MPPTPIANEPISKGESEGANVAAVPVVPHKIDANVTVKIPKDLFMNQIITQCFVLAL